MKLRLPRSLLAAAVVMTAGCSPLPGRLDHESNAPTALPDSLMQSGPQTDVEYHAPARDEVVGCVTVKYDVKPDGTPDNVEIIESHPAGYFDGEVLRLMSAIRFTRRAQTEHGARLFSFVPPNSSYSREAAASLCSPVPSHAELNRKETP